jgi:alpha-glucosidase/alpha-D-xyloside xylohydrolase
MTTKVFLFLGALGLSSATAEELKIREKPAELTLTPLDESAVRITLLGVGDETGKEKLKNSTALNLGTVGKPALQIRSLSSEKTARVGQFRVKVSPNPLRIVLETGGETVQELHLDGSSGRVEFILGSSPIFGLGEGGRQFDRRGDNDPLKSSQDAFNKPKFGGRLPIPWLISQRWALFLQSPLGSIDLSGERGEFTPFPADANSPIDMFVVSKPQPAEMMTELAKLTGFPSMPPLWALGYEQSHRTIENREFVFDVANKFREKQLPADVLIYLGTGWAPSGWNKGHRSFEFNPKAFPDPEKDMKDLHDLHFKVILHEMGPPRGLYGRVSDKPNGDDPNSVPNYWKLHAPLEKLGTDGWWPDEGENLSVESRLARIRMYWEGPQLERPNLRPYTLNRAGYAGMQRFGGWLWSGDLNSSWETLKNQVPVGINTGLSGVPFWGTDIGGFFSTNELTGELYARWFQFGAFCPVFRSHGRPSLLRFPWSWNLGKMGEPESSPDVPESAEPNPAEFHNAAIEPVCKKYLDLRYQMLPYIYSAARETHDTGIPMMRALWLHYPEDTRSARTGDEFLWGRDILVAPVTEKGATTKSVYLPPGEWYDFWTGQRITGAREISRPVDLATMPLYVRAGAILPLGPVKQYFDQPSSEPLTLRIHPGADGNFVLYKDDGVTFNYERGEYARIGMRWNDRSRQLTLNLLPGSKMLNAAGEDMVVQLGAEGTGKKIHFSGKSMTVQL